MTTLVVLMSCFAISGPVCILGCPGAASGLPKPKFHDALFDRRLATGSAICDVEYGCTVEDKDGKGPRLPPLLGGRQLAFFPPIARFGGTAESIDKLAKSRNEAMCYFAFQGLPKPRKLTGMPLDQAELIHHLAMAANQKFQALYPSQSGEAMSAFWNGITTFGNEINQVLCSNGKVSGDQCANASLRSKVPTPYAITIFRLTGSNLETALAQIREWRSVAHLPNEQLVLEDRAPDGPPSEKQIASGQNWGLQGALTAKVVRCSELPAHFNQKVQPPDSLTVDGVNIAEDAINVWKTLENFCAYDAATMSCKENYNGAWIVFFWLPIIVFCCCCTTCGLCVWRFCNRRKRSDLDGSDSESATLSG